VQSVLNGQPLPPPSERLLKAWEDAKREAIKSEYAFKPGLNCACPTTPTHGRRPPAQPVRPARPRRAPSPRVAGAALRRARTDYKKGSPAS
jgi:hypothetical protein